MRNKSHGWRPLPWLLTLGVLMAAMGAAAQADVSVMVYPDTTCAQPAQQFRVYLFVDQAGSQFDGYETVIHYDPNVLQYVSVREESLMVNLCHNTWWHPEQTSGQIFISHVAMCGGLTMTGPGALSSILFQARSTPTLTDLTFEYITFYRAGYIVPSTDRDGAVFVRADCPAIGACCLDAGQCTMASGSECAGLGGDFLGYSATCTPNPCPQPAGCCVGETCQILLQTECTDIGGAWHSGWSSCGPPDPCALPHACCVAGVCHLVLEPECATMQGEWHSEWSSCDDDPCAAQGTGNPEWNGATFLAIVPQPSIGTARITYALRASMSLQLEILDATGRAVRHLIDGAGAAGPVISVWDGLNDAGRPVSPGTYFCRLSAGGEVHTERLVWIE
jgi:hypothetical protein